MSELQRLSRNGQAAQKRHVHLIGICGSAMASLAGMLQLQGWRVTGSDKAAYPPMSDLLEQLHIPIAQPFAERNLEPRPDLVIVGNAISRGNPELEYVLDQRIPFPFAGAVDSRRISCRSRIARDRRDAWQDHNDQHAGVDLRDCRN